MRSSASFSSEKAVEEPWPLPLLWSQGKDGSGSRERAGGERGSRRERKINDADDAKEKDAALSFFSSSSEGDEGDLASSSPISLGDVRWIRIRNSTCTNK